MLHAAAPRATSRTISGDGLPRPRAEAAGDRAIALPRPSARARAALALVAANAIWGTTFVATKPVLARVPPLTLAAARFAVALLVLLPLLARAGRRPRLTRTTAVLGFAGVSVVQLCQNLGLRSAAATDGALIHGGIPVLTALLAAPVLGERPGGRRLVGAGVSLAGVAAALVLGGGGRLGDSAPGYALLLLSALGAAARQVLGKRIIPGQDSLEFVAGVAVFGLLFLIPASGAELAMGGMGRPTAGDVVAILYLGGAASALAFVLWAHGLRHLEAGQAAAFANLNPLTGVAVAAVWLGEPVSRFQIGGCALVLAGVWLAHRPLAAPDREPVPL